MIVMKILLKIEEAAMTLAALYMLSRYSLGLPLWIWILLFFTPDLGMLGYYVNTKTRAVTYNLFHHKAIALLLVALGYWLQNDICTASGILLFAHSSFDRIWGYGLKYSDSFSHTHLGYIGKDAT